MSKFEFIKTCILRFDRSWILIFIFVKWKKKKEYIRVFSINIFCISLKMKNHHICGENLDTLYFTTLLQAEGIVSIPNKRNRA